eukprot:CAMPEP_0184695410 /NCGR_PEP_ID=MMETSP0313-20130426/3039_1 /TAXON_ID=2792 /ORGANISM="Porphyridium aerugineum, Strain SAG 1380-2" /LENGTH=661 /DNA_ID=CAMNT_0027153849 /DNA_START=42 /DNA_END=2027 /DNA_ORIENTATION=-
MSGRFFSDPFPEGVAAWPLSNGPWDVVNSVQVTSTNQYLWLVIVSGFFMFLAAWGIGANDVANAFATSVGAGSISLATACVLAAIMEFSGSVLMGGRVSETIREHILKLEYYDPTSGIAASNGPDVLLFVNSISLLTTAAWLIAATFLQLPVSTTHTIIGSYIGAGFAYRGASSIVWMASGSGVTSLHGVLGVVCSWFISPIMSGIISLILFLFVRVAVLRRSNPVRCAFLFAPFFYFFVVWLVVFMLLFDATASNNYGKVSSFGISMAIAVGCGFGVALMSWFWVIPIQKRKMKVWERRKIAELKHPELMDNKGENGHLYEYLEKVGVHIRLDQPTMDALKSDNALEERHSRAEPFDPKSEYVFSWLQVCTAAFDSFTHGSNDVANAVAPFATIYQTYIHGGNISQRSQYLFASKGTFQGGNLNNQSFAANDPIPNGDAYCGSSANGTEYWACMINFGYLEGNATNDPLSFDLYSSSGVYMQNSTVCYSSCNPGCYVSYQTIDTFTPIWALALGGFGIVVGLSMWGYRIIVSIGKKLTKITASRGFCIEMGASITTLLASAFGLPISTTHCQVGSTIGVGLAEGRVNSIHWSQFVAIFLGWVATLVCCAFMSAGVFAYVSLAPYKFAFPQFLSYCPGQQLFYFEENSNSFRGIVCSGLTG